MKSIKIILSTLLLVSFFFFSFDSNTDSGISVEPIQDGGLKSSIARGIKVYGMMCASCHGIKGTGITGVIPPVAKSDYLKKNPMRAARAIKYGLNGEIKVNKVSYNGFMPKMGLTNEQTTDVMNFMLNKWNDSKQILTIKQVSGIKKSVKK